MPDSRDKHQLAKIALRRRPASSTTPSKDGDVPAAPGVPPSSSSSSTPPAPSASSDDLDGMFDRSFQETFRPVEPAAPAPAAPPPAASKAATPARPLRESSTDIQVDIEEPMTEEQASGGDVTPSGNAKIGFLQSLAADTGVPAIDIDRVTLELAVLEFLPRDVALRNLMLPLAVREDVLLVALADPNQRRALDELEFVSGHRVLPHVAPHSQLRRMIESCYRAHEAGERSFGMPGALPAAKIEAAVVRGNAGSAPAAGGTAGRPPHDSGDLMRMPVTTLPIDLDANPTPLPLPAGPGPAPGDRQRKRILVVDDEVDIRQLVVRVLRDRGYEVFEATQGAEALRSVQSLLPDLLVLDAMLPEIHGFDVCRRIKHSPRYAHIPVIMISAIYRGWRFASDLKKSYGVDHFLEKPFKIGELVERVQQLLSGVPAAPPPGRELSLQAQAELTAGIQKYRENDMEGAVKHLLRGVEADPLSHQLHYQLGILYGKQGRIYQAIQELETALEIEPGDFATLRGLGQLYEHAGFPLKAVEMWERAASASTDEAARSSIKEHLLKLL